MDHLIMEGSLLPPGDHRQAFRHPQIGFTHTFDYGPFITRQPA